MKIIYKIVFFVFPLVLTCGKTFAQNEIDAQRFSAFGTAGTARAQAMGGAFSAVGADFTANWLNPAGLALYRRSEFCFSPGLVFIGNDAKYLSENGIARTTNFGIKNGGYVYSSAVENGGHRKGFNSFAFSVGLNQTANYNRNISVSGFNDQNSISQFFADQSRGYSEAALAQDLGYPGSAYQAYLTLPDTAGNPGVWLPSIPGGNITQSINIVEKGRNNEWSIGLAGNIGDFFYIGGAIGILDVLYTQETFYQEDDLLNVHTNFSTDSTDFNHLEMLDYVKTKGGGFNARLGIIVKPVEFFRIGISAQTPTWLNLKDTYYTELSATFDNDANTYGIPSDQVGTGLFNYNLTTPFKITVGAMLMIKKAGMITVDVDYTDYSTAAFSSDNSPISGGVSFNSQNNAIRRNFGSGINARIGGELRLDMFRLRAGAANYSAITNATGSKAIDFKSGNTIKVNGNRTIFSGGFGIRLEKFYIDLAILREVYQNWSVFYSLDDSNLTQPSLINKKTTTSSLLTIGFTF